VTATFSYARLGRPGSEIGSGGCSRAHALLLGQVTPPLVPGATYVVTIRATDSAGTTTTRTLSFTTRG
jgi:hypothetical protein